LATAVASPEDGLYFPTEGTYLLIREGVVYQGREPGRIGQVEGDELRFDAQPGAPVHLAVVEGHLWADVLRFEPDGVTFSGVLACPSPWRQDTSGLPLASTRMGLRYTPGTQAWTLDLQGETGPDGAVLQIQGGDGRPLPALPPGQRTMGPIWLHDMAARLAGERVERAKAWRQVDGVMLTPLSTDLGPVGLLPVPAPTTLVGRWVTSGSLEVVEVVPTTGSEGDSNQVSMLGLGTVPEPGKVHFRADALGVFHVRAGFDCGMNHWDDPANLFWFALPGGELARFVQPSQTGEFPKLRAGLTRFRRAGPGEPFAPDRLPHLDPAAPEHAEWRDRW
jgi:hypothetical protein